VAERERLTNKERRAQSREERRRKEAEAAARRKRGQIRNGLITFVIVGVIAAVVLQAFLGGPDTIDDAILISSSEAEAAFDEAGCEVLVDRDPLPDRSHFEANQQPNLDTIYPDIRPTHSGPHTVGTHPVTAAAGSQISEAATTHNLEHGTIIAWWDPDAVSGSTASDMGNWAETLNANGFLVERGGVGIMTAPYEDPGISSGKSIALRAWGTAWDCDEWNETVANAFVIENYGTRGIGPERMIAPFPDGVLAYEDRDVDDTPVEQAPADGMDDAEELSEEELRELEEDRDGGDDGAGGEAPDDEDS
jgi:hypothetical protein